jgi:hypothetical protein
MGARKTPHHGSWSSIRIDWKSFIPAIAFIESKDVNSINSDHRLM